MKDMIENTLLVTPIADKNITVNTNKTFVAGTATKKNCCCVCCGGCNGNNQPEVENTSACEEPCNCIIPFCTTMNISQNGGVLTTNPENKRMYFTSNLYYSIDPTPCSATIAPPKGCIDMQIDIYPIRVLGSIDCSILYETEAGNIGVATDTGSATNFVDPARATGIVMTQERTMNVNQVIGYVTDSSFSPVQNGQSIATNELEITFTMKSYNCINCRESSEGALVRCVGSFKLKNCPLTNSQPE